MIELTKLYLADRLYRFKIYGILPFLYQSLNVMLATLLTIIVPYTPFNLLIYILIVLFIYFINPFHLSDQITYICLSDEAIPRAQFSWKSLFKNSYYCYLFVAFILNYDTIHYLKRINI